MIMDTSCNRHAARVTGGTSGSSLKTTPAGSTCFPYRDRASELLRIMQDVHC